MKHLEQTNLYLGENSEKVEGYNKKHKRENKNIIYTDMKTIITNTNLRLRSLLVTLCSKSGRDVLCNFNGF